MYEEPPPKDLAAAVEVQPDADDTAANANDPAAPPNNINITSPSSSPLSADILDIQTLLWGHTIKADIFARWSQGFCFSPHEPSALVQLQGGPCAIIAPVQAFLLHLLLADGVSVQTLSTLSAAKCRSGLVRALCTILAKCGASSSDPSTETTAAGAAAPTASSSAPPPPHRYRIVMSRKQTTRASAAPPQSPRGVDEVPAAAVSSPASPPSSLPDQEDDSSSAPPALSQADPRTCATDDALDQPDSGDFHRHLCTVELDTIEAVHAHYERHSAELQQRYGVLLFMYSVLLTKRLEAIEAELLDTSEPLIHEVYGYASQALINLMLTGRAVLNVWDNDQDIGGLKLKGIDRQSDVGFITLMEQLRYCTVGSFYKNPKGPVWVMGSETHLTVLFSDERRLVSPETAGEIGRRVFKSFDPEGNNFIPTGALQEVLAALGLVSETEYVELMQKRLDPEGLGIILLNGFMDEFFSDSDRPSVPDSFDLLHYNGIPGSNDGQKVRFNRGCAVLLESDLKTMCQTNNPMLTCLQTKWPTIEVNWTMDGGKLAPSLN